MSITSYTPNARETVLTNDYLLHHIFGYFNTGDKHWIPENKHHLGLAALTCRAFVEAAREAQWCVLTSLRPLFRYLEKGWDECVEEFEFSLSEPAENLERFVKIARKVRIIYYFPGDRRHLVAISTQAIVKAVEASGISDPRDLFPGLKTLYCAIPVEWLEDLAYFVSPSLNSLFLHPHSGSYAFRVLAEESLKCLSRMIPSGLRKLNIQTTDIDKSVGSISAFHSITFLSVTGNPRVVTSQFLQNISCLSRLEGITLRFNKFYHSDDTDSQLLSVPWKCGSQSTLKKVNIDGMLPGIVVFMEGLEGTVLTTLEITIRKDPDSTPPPLEDVYQLGKSLAIGGTESLSSLIIRDIASTLPTLRLSGASERLDAKGFIDCLLRFQNLEVLQYSADSFYLYGYEVERIMESVSWRETLRHFMVLHYNEFDDSDVPKEHHILAPNIQQLQRLVFALPNLKTLGTFIQFDEEMFSPPSFSLHPGSKLEGLCIATGELLDEDYIIPIAECLDYSFPSLKWIRCLTNGQKELWDVISGVVQLCQRVRERALRRSNVSQQE